MRDCGPHHMNQFALRCQYMRFFSLTSRCRKRLKGQVVLIIFNQVNALNSLAMAIEFFFLSFFFFEKKFRAKLATLTTIVRVDS